jgi:fatty-acyl-CoA synthase
MAMVDRHFEFWPKRWPRTLTLPETTVAHNLEVSATRYPDRTAIVYYGTEIPYRRLLEEVEALAGYMQEDLGVTKGDRVILNMQNSPQFVISFYAILRANAAVVPVNPMLLTEEIEHYVRDSGAKVAIVGQELHERISPFVNGDGLQSLIVAAYSGYIGEADLNVPEVASAPRRDVGGIPWDEALGAGRAPRPSTAGPGDLACLPYTSGTTGRPKGCMHTHRSMQANLGGTVPWRTLTPETVALVTLPLFHVSGMVNSMNSTIYVGGSMVMMTRWDREVAAELVGRYGCTEWINITTMVVDLLSIPRIGEYDLGTLRYIGGGGAPLPAAVGERLEELTGERYVEGYGLTETMAHTHAVLPDRVKLQCLGVPVFDVDSRVINPETMEELGPNEEGEIVSSGPQVMKGYWGRPDADREVFFERDGKRFLRTGDIGRYDEEGYFFIVDRLKRMINVSGYKVWPTEVESLLYGHPAVKEACVIGVPDERSGEAVKAVIVLREGEEGNLSAEDIIGWARERMAAYKYPRRVEFVDSLPKSGTGKILWRVLQEQEQEKVAERS